MKRNSLALLGATIGLSLSVSSCNSQDVIQAGDSTVVIQLPAESTESSSGDSPVFSNYVCDPFANDPNHSGTDTRHGIIAKMSYLSQPGPVYKNIADMQKNGLPIDAMLFFSDLNVPTRAFSLGFTNQNGDVLLNSQGNTLYEYFSLNFESMIQLKATDPVGPYQFALISDDGSKVQLDTGSGYSTLINNDGEHSSRFTASTQPVVFPDRDTKYKIMADYYQGPRYHIALMLLWRPWPQTGSAVDPQEGKSGNSLFFDSTKVPSVPTATYQGLLSRGWRPVSSENFSLPSWVGQNPCGTEPVATSIDAASPSTFYTNQSSMTLNFSSNLANATFTCSLDGSASSACSSPMTYTSLADGSHQFQVYATSNGKTDLVGASHAWTVDTVAPKILGMANSTASDSFTVTWTTDEPSTSIVYWGQGTSTSGGSSSDPNLTTEHSVTISGLASQSIYSFIIQSLDQAGNPVSSATSRVRTQ